LIRQSYEIVPIDSIHPHPDNPRIGQVDAIATSIRANGWYGAVVVQASSRRVIAGHHRLKAAVAEGLSEVPVLIVDVDDTTAKRILLADNRTSDLAEYNPEALLDALASLTQEAGDLDALIGTGFTSEDLDSLLNEMEADPNAEGPDLATGGPGSGEKMPHLQWGSKKRVPISQAEVQRLDALVDEYVEQNGSQYGFLGYLLREVHGG
jgi:hypothetical protein